MAKAKPKSDAPPTPVSPVVEPAYTVVARRYRPQQFADLIGQEHVAQALTQAIQSKRIAHAYLFTGARGVGKTSTARILAKALNCEQGPTATPCDSCPICLDILSGDDIDVLEIDGASNNKVDEARELRNNVGFRPTRARFKIYIIDEVHMLSNAAFNALLKTMEEPPPHVKFILATTEVQKIPVTILSRCQRYDFNTVGAGKILETLQHIAKKEGIEAETEALRLVARRANGSLRDSQTLLEQLMASCGGRLTLAQAQQVFGAATDETICKLAGHIVAQEALEALTLLGSAAEQGQPSGELLDQLIDLWRGLMIAALAPDEASKLEMAPSLQEFIAQASNAMPLDTILAGLDLLTNTKQKMRGSPHAQVLLEVAVVRLCRLANLLSTAELAQWLGGGAAPARVSLPSAATANIPAHRPAPGPSAAQQRSAPPDVKKKPLTDTPVSAEPATAVVMHDWPIEQLWPRLLGSVSGLLRAILDMAEKPPAIIGPNALVIRYSPRYSAEGDTIRVERNLKAVQDALKNITGANWAVRVEILAGQQVAHANSTGTGASANGTTAPLRPGSRTRDRILALPLIQAAQKVLGAQLMRYDEDFDPVEPTVAPTPVAEVSEDVAATPEAFVPDVDVVVDDASVSEPDPSTEED